MSSKTLILDGPDAVDIVSGLALAAGDYVLSNDGNEVVRLYEAAAAPADGYGHPVLPGGTWSFSVAGDPHWAWAELNGSALVISRS